MSKEAMQMALHTLEGWANYGNWVWPESALEQAKRNTTESIAALRQALETEQEPVAWRSISPDGKLSNKFACKPTEGNWVEPLYTAPPKREWVGPTAWRCQCGKPYTVTCISSKPPKKEWVGLTLNEAKDFYDKYTDRAELINAVDRFLAEKNHG